VVIGPLGVEVAKDLATKLAMLKYAPQVNRVAD
jgi:hypothetical protein